MSKLSVEVKVPAASHTACGRAGLKPDMDSNQRPPSFLPALKTDRLGGTVGAAPALHLKTPGCLLPAGPGSSVPLRQAHSSHTPSAAPPSCTAASHGRGGKRKAGKERRRERRRGQASEPTPSSPALSLLSISWRRLQPSAYLGCPSPIQQQRKFC